MEEKPKRRGRPPKARPEPELTNSVPELSSSVDKPRSLPRPMNQSEYDLFMRNLREFQIASNRRDVTLMEAARDRMVNILNEVIGL